MSNKKSKIYMQQAETIRNRLYGREYILGLDLGVGSIGLAAVAFMPWKKENVNVLAPKDIVFTCARLFPSAAGAANRRNFRSNRNVIRHKKNRLKWVWKTLAKRGLMLPFSDEKTDDQAQLRFSKQVLKENPYNLRFKGLTEELTPEELGYAIYHMANHRGPSSMLADDDGSKGKKLTAAEKQARKQYDESLKKTKEYMKKDPALCYIEILMEFNKESDSKLKCRNHGGSLATCAPMPMRDLIEKELDRLLEKQKEFHPELIDDEFAGRIKSAVLFENEMIVPEPGLCPYTEGEEKLPAAAFINEERRLREAVNNIRYTLEKADDEGYVVSSTSWRGLNREQRDICYQFLRKGTKNLTPNAIWKLLPELNGLNFKLQGNDKKDMKIEKFKFKNLERSPVFNKLLPDRQIALLRDWTNAAREKPFRDKLLNDYGFTEDDANKLIREQLPRGVSSKYAPCGLTAMTILMPYIENGLSYQQAVRAAIEEGNLKERNVLRNYDRLPYYGKAVNASTQALMGKSWHSAYKCKIENKDKGFHSPETAKEEETYGRIANPVVHQTLNELRKLVNEVISILGKKPAFVVVETGREMKVGAKKREEISNNIAKKAKANEKIIEEYITPHIDAGTLSAKDLRRLIRTFRLYKEQKEKCPYCGNEISVDDILEGRADLDHLFPRNDIPGNPDVNLVVAHKDCNETTKGKKTPYGRFYGTDRWNTIVSAADNFPREKKWRLTCSDDDYEKWKEKNGMQSRFKTDNAYVALVAKDYLSVLFSDEELRHDAVRTIRGQETAMLRKAWDLQDITYSLAENLDSEAGKPEYNPKKNRNDVRHHVIDAIVAAFSTRNVIQTMNFLSGKGVSQLKIMDCIKLPLHFTPESENDRAQAKAKRKEFHDYVERIVFSETFVSRKIDHDSNGPLVDATILSLLSDDGETAVTFSMKAVIGLKSEAMEGNKAKTLRYDLNLNKFPSLLSKLENPVRKTLERMESHNQAIYESVKKRWDETEQRLNIEDEKFREEKVRAEKDKRILRAILNSTEGKYYDIDTCNHASLYIMKAPTDGKPGRALKLGENYRIDLYHDSNGNLRGEVIRKIDAMNKGFVPNYVKAGYSCVGHLSKGDILEIDSNKAAEGSLLAKTSSVHVPNATAGRTFIVICTSNTTDRITELRVDSLLSSEIKKNGSLVIESNLKEYHARLISLSSAGLVKYASPVLEDL